MTKKDFMKWAEAMAKNIDYERYFSYIIPADMTTILCYDKKTKKSGLAKCHPKDMFDRTIGKAIAYAKCTGIKIPILHDEKHLCEMKYGDKFYAPYYSRKTEYMFLGKMPNVTHNEWLATPTDDFKVLVHFFFDIEPYEMVE